MRSPRIAVQPRWNVDQPSLGAARRNVRDEERRGEPQPGDRDQQQPRKPGLCPRDRDDDPTRHGAADDRQAGPHLDLAVACRKPLVGQDLGQDAVLGWAEKRRLCPQQAQDHQGRRAPRRNHPEQNRARHHECELEEFRSQQDASLAVAVGQDAAGKVEDNQRHQQDELGQGRTLLRGRFAGGCRDHQQHRDLLPRIIVERTQGLGDDQPQQWMPGSGLLRGCLSYGQHSESSSNSKASTSPGQAKHATGRNTR